MTSAEAVLVSLQSHNEVLSTLDSFQSIRVPWEKQDGTNGVANGHLSNRTNDINGHQIEGKLFVASVSPQARASLAAVFNVSEVEAGNMITQLLSGPSGIRIGGTNGSDFTWVIDTNVMRDACLVAAANEVSNALSPEALIASTKPNSGESIDAIPKQPILTSACPGWICYAEKTHPYILPHLSRLKSPQALTGTLIKSVLSERYNVSPSQIWHLAIMPCFDKKLEASRSELTSSAWLPNYDSSQEKVRDVDCVITARELIHLASARGINFASLPRTSLPSRDRTRFPDQQLDAFLFPPSRRKKQDPAAGSSDGFLHHILQTYQAQHPGSSISISRGRNADVVEYSLVRGSETIIRAARFYGFRNIQNLVRRLKPARASRLPGSKAGVSRRPGGNAAAAAGESVKEYAYVEVMACPGGCTNGGGQIKASEVRDVRIAEGVEQASSTTDIVVKPGPKEQKEWLARVDEAYFSASDSGSESDVDTEMSDADDTVVDGISVPRIEEVLRHWSEITGVERKKLIYTSYIKVESDVGKKKVSDMERVAGLAVSVGGGW